MASEINPTEIRASAFQTRLPLPNCNVLVKCEDPKSSLVSPIANNNSLRVPAALTSNSNMSTNNSNNSSSNNGSAVANSNSPKMGSRRIFTPQFKLQVLESYRSDSDCKGNQRATARKYNIHRRQIQKWLQCESNLRSSVANINQNSVKHQFHNISHHHQQQHQQGQQLQQQHSSAQRLSLPIAVPSASRSGANNGYSHLQHHHHHNPNHPQVPLDAARQTLVLNSLNVPSMPNRVASTNASSAQGVLAANLAAAVAVAIASSSSPSTSTTAVSPLRPTAIGGAAGGSSVSPSLLHAHHHHHHHHYPLSPYARSPVAAPVPVSVPMLPHHIAPPQQPHAALHHHHQHYPYHNLSSHTHAHALPLSHQASAFLPTACLPVNVLSAVAAASPPATATANVTNTTTAADMQEKEIEDNCTDANANVKAKLCEPAQDTTTTTSTATTTTSTTTTGTINSMIALPETITTTTTAAVAVAAATTTPAAAMLLMGTSARSYIHESEYECVYRGAMYVDEERMRDAKTNNALQSMHYHYADQDSMNISMTSPMDLSVGSRRKTRECFDSPVELPRNVIDEDNTECHSQETCGNSNSNNVNNNNNHSDNSTSTQVVDLTFRKRKVVTAACSVSANDTEQPQKLAKRFDDNSTDSKEAVDAEKTSNHMRQNAGSDEDDDDDDVEIEVEVDVDAKHLSSKPVKLFKPYLLDDTDDNDAISKGNGNNSPSQLVMNEQREPIIWSNHPAFSYDSSRASSLHSPTASKHTFPNGSPYFLASKASSPQSALSPTSAPSLSPTSFPLRCPKGSPVSGYESSSSTCSERDDSYRSYSLDFQMHTVCEDKVVSTLHKPMHIREWLDQDTNTDTNTPPLARASIAMYA